MNRRILLKARPHGVPGPECYTLQEAPIPQPRDGEVLIRNVYLSLDPAIRSWMSEAPNYAPPIPVGAVMRGLTIGRVIESRFPGLAPGDLVAGMNGWEDYSVAAGARLRRIPSERTLPLTAYLSVLGTVGLTAYFGLLEIGQPQPGQTILVSGAAGTVGSLVGQIARIKGCRAVGIAGGAEKCSWLTNECGFDAAIDYKAIAADDMQAAIRAACPQGVDIYFDNVGGSLLESVLWEINQRARIVICGAITQYNSAEPAAGPRNLWQLLVKSARIEGFLVMNYAPRLGEAAAQLTSWIDAGLIRYREQLVPGLENAPSALPRLFSGDHRGKLLVDVASHTLAN